MNTPLPTAPPTFSKFAAYIEKLINLGIDPEQARELAAKRAVWS